jgi:hypothetical protein
MEKRSPYLKFLMLALRHCANSCDTPASWTAAQYLFSLQLASNAAITSMIYAIRIFISSVLIYKSMKNFRHNEIYIPFSRLALILRL